MSHLEYKIPRILWESLEAVLLAQSKKYIEELANRLHVPAKELQKRVMPSADSIKVLLQEVQEGLCQAHVQNGEFTVFCRKPVLNSTFCTEHQFHRSLVLIDDAINIQKVKDIDMLPPIWIKESDTTLYYSNNTIAGKINHDKQKIKIYVTTDED